MAGVNLSLRGSMHTRGSLALLLPLTRGRTFLPSPLKQENIETVKSEFVPLDTYSLKTRDGQHLPLFLGHLSPPNRRPKEMPHNCGGCPHSPHRSSIQPHQYHANQLRGVSTTTKIHSTDSFNQGSRVHKWSHTVSASTAALPVPAPFSALCCSHIGA